MGVKGFTWGLVKSNKRKLLSDHRLHHTRVIIDGNNLVYFLQSRYNVPLDRGGDYDSYAEACRDFFNILKQCHIVPYVIFDGGYAQDDSKLDTLLRRAQKKRSSVVSFNRTGKISLRPILAKETFKHVMVELQIPHASCHYEADKEIAVLAKKWGCPVMSNDSDFFIYDLDGGMMPFDFVKKELHVYDEQSNEEYPYDTALPLTEHQILYIPVKLYLSERFTKKFPKRIRSFVLPVVATLLGNDFVDSDTDLESFHSTLRASVNEYTGFYIPDTHVRLKNVLHWLRYYGDVDSGLENVIARTRCGDKEMIPILRAKIKSSLENCQSLEEKLKKYVGRSSEGYKRFKKKLKDSIEDYQNLEKFSSVNLVQFFECGTDDREAAAASSGPANLISEIQMVDFNGIPLPQWFIERRVACEIATFLQNAAVLHRVIFDCQIELLDEPSAYKCSIGIRQVMYGILKKTSARGKGGKRSQDRKRSIEELDRCGVKQGRNFVEPFGELAGFGSLPNIRDLAQESESNRRALLFRALEVPSTVVDSMDAENEMSIFLVAVAAYWRRHARPKVNKNDLKSLFLCALYLHVKRLECMDDTASGHDHAEDNTASGHDHTEDDTVSGHDHTEPAGLHADIVAAYRSSCEAQIRQVNEKMKSVAAKHLEDDHTVDVSIVHGFAQFQTCWKAAIHLNQLLMSPLPPPNPSLIFNGTVVYNLRRESSLDDLISDILGRGTPLHALFRNLMKQVKQVFEQLEGGDSDQLEETYIPESDDKSPKHARGRGGRQVDVVDTSTGDMDGMAEACQGMTLDPKNRFLMLSDM